MKLLPVPFLDESFDLISQIIHFNSPLRHCCMLLNSFPRSVAKSLLNLNLHSHNNLRGCRSTEAVGLGRIYFSMGLDVAQLQTLQTRSPSTAARFTARAGLLPEPPVKAPTAESTQAFIETLLENILTPEVRAAAEAI